MICYHFIRLYEIILRYNKIHYCMFIRMHYITVIANAKGLHIQRLALL